MSAVAPPSLHYGTVIAVENRAVLIRGPSGSGKSDLALRCLNTQISSNFLPNTTHQNCVLIADDYVVISPQDNKLIASAPETIHGRLEVRGLGIVAVKTAPSAELVMVADLTTPDQIERLPLPWPQTELLGVRLPNLFVAPFEASAPIKILIALTGQIETGLTA
ncbi:MAG: HPr kinase/phosphorylase [Hyphomicrobiaceae bacterium]